MAFAAGRAAPRYLPRPGQLFAGLAAVIAVAGVLARIQQTEAVGWVDGFHPDGEGNAFAALSGLVLVVASIASFLLGERLSGARGRLRLLGVALLVMAADELLSIHERLESGSGADWQLLYLPLALVGAWLFLSLLAVFRAHGALGWVIWVPPVWVVSQVLEYLQWEGDTQVHPWMVVPEEVLELLGSALLLVGLVAALRTVARREAPPVREPPPSRRSGTPTGQAVGTHR